MSSYAEFVRPIEPGKPIPDRYGDLFFGTGGVGGFAALIPLVRDNLERAATEAESAGDHDQAAARRQLAKDFPWIYPPFQTWAYIAGFVLTIDLAAGALLMARQHA